MPVYYYKDEDEVCLKIEVLESKGYVKNSETRPLKPGEWDDDGGIDEDGYLICSLEIEPFPDDIMFQDFGD